MRAALVGLMVAVFATCAIARAQSIPAPSPTPQRQSLADAWWTGPLLAPSANTLPRGHVLVEPYLYNVIQYGSYDGTGALKPAPHSNGFGSLTYLIYGVTDRFGVGLIPTFGYTTVSGGLPSDRVGFGDLSVLAQYRLTQYRLGYGMPIISINVEETLPTGQYDNLGDRPNDGFGGGVYTTKVSLYSQTYAWMRNGRILRLRLNLSHAFSSSANVDGVSVFGTSNLFHGSVRPGDSNTIDLAGEYSITRNWVVASDLVFGYTGSTLLSGANGVTEIVDSHSFAFAPAVEYNWTANAGIIFGVRLFPAGRNTAASVTPALAVNMVR